MSIRRAPAPVIHTGTGMKFDSDTGHIIVSSKDILGMGQVDLGAGGAQNTTFLSADPNPSTRHMAGKQTASRCGHFLLDSFKHVHGDKFDPKQYYCVINDHVKEAVTRYYSSTNEAVKDATWQAQSTAVLKDLMNRMTNPPAGASVCYNKEEFQEFHLEALLEVARLAMQGEYNHNLEKCIQHSTPVGIRNTIPKTKKGTTHPQTHPGPGRVGKKKHPYGTRAGILDSEYCVCPDKTMTSGALMNDDFERMSLRPAASRAPFTASEYSARYLDNNTRSRAPFTASEYSPRYLDTNSRSRAPFTASGYPARYLDTNSRPSAPFTASEYARRYLDNDSSSHNYMGAHPGELKGLHERKSHGPPHRLGDPVHTLPHYVSAPRHDPMCHCDGSVHHICDPHSYPPNHGGAYGREGCVSCSRR